MDRGSCVRGAALAIGLAGLGLQAQSPALPASDPVGLGRGGAGVAFGRSPEATALNPALLATVENRGFFYLAGGMDLESTQLTLQSNQRTLYSTDRNRAMPAFGAAWRISDRLVLGVVGDTPFARHLRLSPESTARFLGDRIDYRADRIRFQAGFKVSDQFSLGAALGVARMKYEFGSTLRLQVPQNASLPVSASNPSLGLVETGAVQSGSGLAPALSLGFRYAVNPRWTVGGTAHGPLKRSMSMSAQLDGRTPSVFANDGYGAPPLGTESAAAALLARSSAVAGRGDLDLPWSATVGVRQRVNQLFTWEFDLRYVGSARTATPNAAGIATPSGLVETPVLAAEQRNTSAATLMGELSLSKRWTARAAATLEQGWRSETTVTPVHGGAKTAAFSVGFGLRAMGGEWLAGYQFRQSRDIDSAALDGAWSRLGYHPTGSTTRVEGMGHLLSVGFRIGF